MMVDGGHFEDALFAQLVAADLEDDGKRLNHEDAADKGQQQFLADDDGHGSDGSPEGERAYIAHEDFGGMGVIPEEADAGPHHRSAENGDLADHGHSLKFKVVGKDGMSADVGEDGEGSGGGEGADN